MRDTAIAPVFRDIMRMVPIVLHVPVDIIVQLLLLLSIFLVVYSAEPRAQIRARPPVGQIP